jgi:hypothetical protein
LARRGFSRCSNLHRRQPTAGLTSHGKDPALASVRETAAQLGIVHVLSHSRHRQYVVTVTIVARVSTALPWQKGQMAGRAPRQRSVSQVSSLSPPQRVLNGTRPTAYQSRRAIVSSSRRSQSRAGRGILYKLVVV